MAANDPVRRVEIAASGGRRKAQNDILRDKRFAEHAEYIRRIDESRPPLTELQRARLAALLLRADRRDEAEARIA